jgi:hypothetical protein
MFKKKKKTKWEEFIDALNMSDYLALNSAMVKKNVELMKFSKEIKRLENEKEQI